MGVHSFLGTFAVVCSSGYRFLTEVSLSACFRAAYQWLQLQATLLAGKHFPLLTSAV